MPRHRINRMHSTRRISPPSSGGCGSSPPPPPPRPSPPTLFSTAPPENFFFCYVSQPHDNSGAHGRANAPWQTRPVPPGEGGGRHKASVFGCLPLAAPIGLSPLLILILCGPEHVLVVSTGEGGGMRQGAKDSWAKPLGTLHCPVPPSQLTHETCPPPLLLMNTNNLEPRRRVPQKAQYRGRGGKLS